MKHSLTIAVFIALAALSGGCIKKGSVSEGIPLSAKVSSYKSASIAVTAPPGTKNVEVLRTELTNKVREAGLVSEVVDTGGELGIMLTVKKLDEGSAGLTAMAGNAGSAEVIVDVKFADTKESKDVGQITVTGNSKRNGQVSVNGINTAAASDQTNIAYAEAAIQIVEYLKQHR